MGPSVCVHMTLLPVPGTASEVARETILGPSTAAFVPHGDPVCKQSEPVPNNVIPEALCAASTDEICPQIAGKRAAGGAPSQARMDPANRARRRKPQSAGPTRFASFIKKSAELRRRAWGRAGCALRRRWRRDGDPRVRRRRRPVAAGAARRAKTQKGRPLGRPFSRSCRARVSGLEPGSYSSSAGAPSPKPKSASGPKISASDSESTVICAATSASSRSRS